MKSAIPRVFLEAQRVEGLGSHALLYTYYDPELPKPLN